MRPIVTNAPVPALIGRTVRVATLGKNSNELHAAMVGVLSGYTEIGHSNKVQSFTFQGVPEIGIRFDPSYHKLEITVYLPPGEGL